MQLGNRQWVRGLSWFAVTLCVWSILALSGPVSDAQAASSPHSVPQVCGGNTNQGYWLAGADGGVFSFGSANYYGSMAGQRLDAPIVGIAPTAFGYWLVGADGGVFSFGCAPFYGSAGGLHLNAPMVGMAASLYGGYWLVSADGGVFSFGGAPFYGSMAGHPLNSRIVGMAATYDGLGYWLVSADGGVFSFGDAQFQGSAAGKLLPGPIVGIAAVPSMADSYWLAGADGSVYNFGYPATQVSASGTHLAAPIVGIAAVPSMQSCNPGVPPTQGPASGGYRLVGADGGVFSYGDAQFLGSESGHSLVKPIVGIASWEPPPLICPYIPAG